MEVPISMISGEKSWATGEQRSHPMNESELTATDDLVFWVAQRQRAASEEAATLRVERRWKSAVDMVKTTPRW